MVAKITEDAELQKIEARHEELDRQKMKLLKSRIAYLEEELGKRDTKDLEERIKNCKDELEELKDIYEPKKGRAYGDPYVKLGDD